MAALFTPAAFSASKLMVQSRESAAALDALLRGAAPQEHGEIQELAAEIRRCCDRALAALHGFGGKKRKSGAGAHTRPPSKRPRASGGETAAAKRVEKRCTAEDGFAWRKYGHKEIHNTKHPRLYFRCTYRDDRGCPATRQVQLSEDDPSLYVITYFGHHTCRVDVFAAAAPSEVNALGETHPSVIDVGSAAAACAGQSETSRSYSPNGCLPEGGNGEEELRPKVAKVVAAGGGAELPRRRIGRLLGLGYLQ